MPWWGWVIVGVVSFVALWYAFVMVLMLTVWQSVSKELKNNKKGW
jgi:hypothetical protein